MARKIIWFIVAVLIIGVVLYAYQYNDEFQRIMSNINFSNANEAMNKVKELAQQLSWAVASGTTVVLSGTDTVISGAIDTLSGTVAEVASGANEALSGTIN